MARQPQKLARELAATKSAEAALAIFRRSAADFDDIHATACLRQVALFWPRAQKAEDALELQELLHRLRQRTPALDVEATVINAWSLAKLQEAQAAIPRDLQEALCSAVERRRSEFSGRHLATVLWAFAKSPAGRLDTVASLATEVPRLLPDMSAQGLANCFFALASHGPWGDSSYSAFKARRRSAAAIGSQFCPLDSTGVLTTGNTAEMAAVISEFKNGYAQDSPMCATDVDTESTGASSSEDGTVKGRLVDVPRKLGMRNLQLIMDEDMLNRYQAKKEACNFLLKCETWFAEYLGMKYALSLNSGGIAISLGLEAMKRVLFPDDTVEQIRVYSNAFTFNAVPSACLVAGFGKTLKLIEATSELVIDLDHLEKCIQDDLKSGKFAPGKMILVLSYMRGRVPDMHRVLAICEKYQIQLLEDSAHGYGCSFDGRKCGSFGVVSTISSQANKLVNTGEGGMVFTNNHEIQAFFIFSAGSYEELWRKHEAMSPPEEVCLKYKYTTVNKSVRMTNIQGALMHPQLAVMNDRIDQHNEMYYYLVRTTSEKLEEVCGKGASKSCSKGSKSPVEGSAPT
eukprot:s3558_g1.t1